MYNERTANSKGHPVDVYSCSSYRKHTTDCTMHFIRTDVVRELILSALRSVSEYAKANREAFEQLVMDTTTSRQTQQIKESRKTLADRQRRYDELDVLIQHLYEDHVAGKLTDKRFLKLSQQYEAERERVESDLARLTAAQSVSIPFVEIEALIGKPLCKSAFKYCSYWYPGENRPISNVIYNSGLDVDRVDLKNQMLYLIRAA